MENILSDTSKFKLANNQDIYKISRTIETRVRNYLRDKVKKPGYITDAQYTKFYPNGSRIGVMYGQPKVHKPGAPLRPVCSAIGTATYDLGKYLADVIAPAKTSSYGTDLHSTFTFVDQIKDIDMTGLVMVSYDVRSLFTNVPLQRTIDICMDRMYRSESITPPTIPEDVLRKLISLCVCNNTFVFDGKVYEQIDGVAMGTLLKRQHFDPTRAKDITNFDKVWNQRGAFLKSYSPSAKKGANYELLYGIEPPSTKDRKKRKFKPKFHEPVNIFGNVLLQKCSTVLPYSSLSET
ncbi:hypothetical protein ACHWQZ_G000132 [Mnemiopsis leidyi]